MSHVGKNSSTLRFLIRWLSSEVKSCTDMWGPLSTRRGTPSADRWAYSGNHLTTSRCSLSILHSSLFLDGSGSPSLCLISSLSLSFSPSLSRFYATTTGDGITTVVVLDGFLSPPLLLPCPQVTCDSFCCRCISPSRTHKISGCPRHGRCLRKIDPPALETASLAPPRVAQHRRIVPPTPIPVLTSVLTQSTTSKTMEKSLLSPR
jgi:hypothetical protein